MYKDILLKKSSGFSVCGGVLVPGDSGVYRLKMDMGEDASHFSAMAICQESGEYSGDYYSEGNIIYCTLLNSMYQSEGYITVRFTVSDGENLLTAKEVAFEVVCPNNQETLAVNEQSNIEKILSSAQIAESALAQIELKADKADVYTKSEIDGKISSESKFKGSKQYYSELPSQGNSPGDIWNVKKLKKLNMYGYKILKVEISGSSGIAWFHIDSADGFTENSIFYIYFEGNVIPCKITYIMKDNGDDFYRIGTQGIDDEYHYNFFNIVNKLKQKYIDTEYRENDMAQYKYIVNETAYFSGENITAQTATQGSEEFEQYSHNTFFVWEGKEWKPLSKNTDLKKYYTKDEIQKMLEEVEAGNVDLTGYAKTSDLPTKVSELTNDSGFQTAMQVQSMLEGINISPVSYEEKGYKTNRKLGCVDFPSIGSTDYCHIILYGQSLASGTETPNCVTDAVDGIYMVGSDPHWVETSESKNNINTLSGAGTENPVIGLMHHFAKRYNQLPFSNKNVKFIGNSTGLGGRTIEALSKGYSNTIYGNEHLYEDRFLGLLDSAKSAVSALGKTISCPAVVWMQGEYNYGESRTSGTGYTTGSNAAKDKEGYKARLLQLKNDIQSDVMAKYDQSQPPLFFLYQVGSLYLDGNDIPINMAMIELAKECDDVILLPSPIPCPRYVGSAHMSINGYRWYGELMAKQLIDTLTFTYKESENLHIKNIDIKGSSIYIEYAVPHPPLVLDAKTVCEVPSYGFRVWQGDSGVPINNVSVKHNTVILETSRVLSGEVAVSYAGNHENQYRGLGNLRDSDEYRSLYTYYNDSEELSSNSSEIIYRPINQEGTEIIYDRNYPMMNWANSEYYVVNASEVSATSFTASIDKDLCVKGDKVNITNIQYYPSSANAGKSISWASSNSSVATVSGTTISVVGETAGETANIVGTLENGYQVSLTITIADNSNPYFGYYAYYDMANEGDRGQTQALTNLCTNEADAQLVGLTSDNSATDGWLSDGALTLSASNTGIKIPVKADMPDSIEIDISVTMPVNSTESYPIWNKKACFALGTDSRALLTYGGERWTGAWAGARTYNETSGEQIIDFRSCKDENWQDLNDQTQAFSTSYGYGNKILFRVILNADNSSALVVQYPGMEQPVINWAMPYYIWNNTTSAHEAIESLCSAWKSEGNNIYIGFRPDNTTFGAPMIIHSVTIKEHQ